MINTKFWKPSISRISMIKGLGVGGGIFVAVLAVVGLLFFLFVVKPAYSMVKNINDVKSDAKDIQKAFAERDLVLFEKTLDKTQTDLEDLRKVRDKNFDWTKNLPLFRGYFSDSDHFIQAGFFGVKAGKEFIVVIKPFADAVGLKVSETQEVEQKGLAEAFSTWISVMPQVANDLDGVLVELSEIGKELSYVDASRYPESFRGVRIRSGIVGAQKLLSKVNDNAPDIKKALTVIPGVLGVGTGEKRYMIIMQNNAEIRATGGFWTNYATFKVKDALLNSDFSSKDMYSIDFILDAIDATFTFPSVPAAYQRHLKVERMYARDANISPDFPTAVDQFMYFYKLAMRVAPYEVKPVDGIFAIDTEVIKQLLEITGSVTVNGTTYDSGNVVLELEKIASLSLKEQTGRKRVLGDLMEGMLIKVFESDKNLWPQLVDKGVSLANNKHILGFLFDPESQALLEKYNYAGRIIDPIEGDFDYFVSTNLGGDKTNLFITKEIEHALSKDKDKWLKTVRIKYKYNKASDDYASLVKLYRDWFRLYVPEGSEFIGLEGSDEASETGKERGKTYFAGHMTLGPDGEHEVVFKYYVPDFVVKDDLYTLYIEKQPGVGTEKHLISVNGKTDVIELAKDYKYSKQL